MWRKPLLEVRGSSGRNILPGLDGLWMEVSTSERSGKASDTARITCVGPPSMLALPKRGDVYEILMGWADEGLVLQGRYSFQKPRAFGDPRSGELIQLQFRAADYVDELNKGGRQHFDDVTYGDLVRKLAGKAGLGAEIDPDLDKIKLGYRLWWDQSVIDYATEISAEVGATLKPAGGKLVAMKRGGGKSGAGRDLAPIIITRRRDFSYEVEIDPRPEVGSVAAAWQDPKSGKRKLVKVSGARKGPIKVLPHPYQDEDAARQAAEADAYECNNASGSGAFESPGLPHARAEAPVTVSGFGPMIDGVWKAERVDKVMNARGGFRTTVHVTAGADAKGKAAT